MPQPAPLQALKPQPRIARHDAVRLEWVEWPKHPVERHWQGWVASYCKAPPLLWVDGLSGTYDRWLAPPPGGAWLVVEVGGQRINGKSLYAKEMGWGAAPVLLEGWAEAPDEGF